MYVLRTLSTSFLHKPKLFDLYNQARTYTFTRGTLASAKKLPSLKNLPVKNDNRFDMKKARLITEMHFKSPEDALPFYKLPISKLIVIFKRIKLDERTGFCKNRLYYIAEHIQYPASKLSEPVSMRPFVFTLSSEWLTNSLQVLKELGISGDRIARDLWVLKYHHATIRQRLEHVKGLGVDNLYPWMVRCSQDILNRSIKISLDTKSILGDNLSTQMYIAQRLKISVEDVEEMCNKFPSLRTIRVTKVKSFLDYLISEGFTAEEIARAPRVLTASLSTVRGRVAKLRARGRGALSLNILCRSNADFEKYLQTLKFLDDTKDDQNIS